MLDEHGETAKTFSGGDFYNIFVESLTNCGC